MTQIFPFTMPRNAPFTFQPTLDGATYSAEVRWNLYGQRPYLHLYDENGTLIVASAVTGSPDPVSIASMVWDGRRRKEIVTTAVTHGIKLGEEAVLVVASVLPAALNGVYAMAAEGDSVLTYDQQTDPGLILTQGVVGGEFDITTGYFVSSRVIFRDSSRQFEVTP